MGDVSRTTSLALIAIIVLTNLVALGQLVHDPVRVQVKGGGTLLLAALQVWRAGRFRGPVGARSVRA